MEPDKARLNIIEQTRTKKSSNIKYAETLEEKIKKKYDANSKWFKGFPTDASKEAPDLELTSELQTQLYRGLISREKD